MWGLCGSLFLACQTHLFGVLIGGLFFLLIILEALEKKENKFVIPILGYGIGVVTFFLQLFPLSNFYALAMQNSLSSKILSFDKVIFSLKSIWRGFIPIPMPILHFWNTNILDFNKYLHNIQPMLAILILGITIIYLMQFKEKKAFLFYFIGSYFYLLIIYITCYLPIRFYGFIFILFMLSAWIGFSLQKRRNEILLSFLLIIHVIATCVAYYFDMKYPFSAAKKTAQFINLLDTKKWIVVGYRDTPISTLCGYLNTKIFYPQANRLGSFIKWDATSFKKLTTCEVIKKAVYIKHLTKKPVLIVLNYFPAQRDLHCFQKIKLLYVSPLAIVPDEMYSVWVINGNIKNIEQ